MRRSPLLAVILAILALFACRPAPPPIDNSAVVADAKSAFVIVDALALYSLSADQLTFKETVPLGEKLSLTGTKASVTQTGKKRDFLAVKRASGTTGWARADQLAPHALLAVLTTAETPIFSRPLDSAATGATLQRLTVIAIDIGTAGTTFLKVAAYDSSAKMLLRDVYIHNDGTSSRIADIEPAILLRLAAASQTMSQQKAFLDSGIKDYPDSVFLEDLKAARTALEAPPPAADTGTATDSTNPAPSGAASSPAASTTPDTSAPVPPPDPNAPPLDGSAPAAQPTSP